MGGYGSGRWERPTRKTCVEDCLVLNANELSRRSLLRVGAKGEIQWTPSDPDGHVASVRFHVDVNYVGERAFCIVMNVAITKRARRSRPQSNWT